MKTLIALSLLTLAAIGAQTINHYTAFQLSASDVTASKSYDIGKARADLRQGCIEAKALTCRLIVIERDGRTLAAMDLDGNWTEYASKQEIADVIAAAATPRFDTPRPINKVSDGLLLAEVP